MLASVESPPLGTRRLSPARSLRPHRRSVRGLLPVVSIQNTRFEHGQFSSSTGKTAYRRFFDPEKSCTGLLAANDPIDNTDATGLDVVEPGVWQVTKGESLWNIYQKLHARGAGDAPSWAKFIENVQHNMPGQNLDQIKPGQLIHYRDPQRELLVVQMATQYRKFLTAFAQARAPEGELSPDVMKRIEYSSFGMQEIAELLDTGAAWSHSLSREMGIGTEEMSQFNWNTFRTAFSEYVGTTTRLGQSAEYAKLAERAALGQKAAKVGKAFAYFDVLVSAYTFGNAMATGKEVGKSFGELAATVGTTGLTFMGSVAAPGMAIPWALYYGNEEWVNAQNEVSSAEMMCGASAEAAVHLNLFLQILEQLKE